MDTPILRLRIIRMLNNISQWDIARALGLKQSHIAHWEKVRDVKHSTISHIMKIVKATPDVIYVLDYPEFLRYLISKYPPAQVDKIVSRETGKTPSEVLGQKI